MKKYLLKVGVALVSALVFSVFSGLELAEVFWFPGGPLLQEPRRDPNNPEQIIVSLCNPIPTSPPLGWPFAAYRQDHTPDGCSTYSQFNALAFGLNFALFFGVWWLAFRTFSMAKKRRTKPTEKLFQ